MYDGICYAELITIKFFKMVTAVLLQQRNVLLHTAAAYCCYMCCCVHVSSSDTITFFADCMFT